MNAVKSFFAKYHAVRANDAGPQWRQASDEALLEWFRSCRSVVVHGLHSRPGQELSWAREFTGEAAAAERQAMLPAYNEIVAEVLRRAALPGASGEMFAASLVAGMKSCPPHPNPAGASRPRREP